MITKFKLYTNYIKEEYVFSGKFSTIVDGIEIVLSLKYDEDIHPFRIYLFLDGKNYQELSVIIPSSEKLEHNEFYLSADTDINITETLLKENFITKTNKEDIAGDKLVKSYSLIL